MITREQVADLRPGDVVRVTGWQGLIVEGPVSASSVSTDTLWLGDYLRLTYDERSRAPWLDQPGTSLTVISRAPRPLYVNHDRAEPVPGDVVRSAEDDRTWMAWYDADGDWCARDQHVIAPELMPERLVLLVDGETGQVVPS